jgi:predicted deacylase
VLHGTKPGPILAIVSGSRGTEYASILAVQTLIEAIDPTHLSGTLILVPLVNVPAFERLVRINPLDTVSMNGFYPGRIDGTQAERASYAITHEIIDQCDYLIDLHSATLDQDLRPFSYWKPSGKKGQDDTSRALVLAFGLDHIVIATEAAGDAEEISPIEALAREHGKPSFTAFGGGGGTSDARQMNILTEGSENVMRHLRMLEGTAHQIPHPVWIENILTVKSTASGMFHPLVPRGAQVDAGAKLGLVTDYLGRTLIEVRAPQAGVLLFIRALPSVANGETIANVGVVKRDGR